MTHSRTLRLKLMRQRISHKIDHITNLARTSPWHSDLVRETSAGLILFCVHRIVKRMPYLYSVQDENPQETPKAKDEDQWILRRILIEKITVGLQYEQPVLSKDESSEQFFTMRRD